MMNATQYEFDVDVDAPVGTVLFTVLISAEDPSIASHFILRLQKEFLTFSVNQGAKLSTSNINVKNNFEYDNDTKLYNVLVNIVLHKPFDPNDNLTAHQTELTLFYEDNILTSRETVDVILHIKGKPSLICFIRSFVHSIPCSSFIIAVKFL